jgi:hypothetical protein
MPQSLWDNWVSHVAGGMETPPRFTHFLKLCDPGPQSLPERDESSHSLKKPFVRVYSSSIENRPKLKQAEVSFGGQVDGRTSLGTEYYSVTKSSERRNTPA